MPLANNIYIDTYVPAVNLLMSGEYTYDADGGGSESGTNYQWVQYDDDQLSNPVNRETIRTRTPAVGDIGKYFRFGVRVSDGSSQDIWRYSDVIGPVLQSTTMTLSADQDNFITESGIGSNRVIRLNPTANGGALYFHPQGNPPTDVGEEVYIVADQGEVVLSGSGQDYSIYGDTARKFTLMGNIRTTKDVRFAQQAQDIKFVKGPTLKTSNYFGCTLKTDGWTTGNHGYFVAKGVKQLGSINGEGFYIGESAEPAGKYDNVVFECVLVRDAVDGFGREALQVRHCYDLKMNRVMTYNTGLDGIGGQNHNVQFINDVAVIKNCVFDLSTGPISNLFIAGCIFENCLFINPGGSSPIAWYGDRDGYGTIGTGTNTFRDCIFVGVNNEVLLCDANAYPVVFENCIKDNASALWARNFSTNAAWTGATITDCSDDNTLPQVSYDANGFLVADSYYHLLGMGMTQTEYNYYQKIVRTTLTLQAETWDIPDEPQEPTLPSHTGTTWGASDLSLWRQRAVSGPYKVSGDAFADSPAAYTEILARADAFVTDPSTDYITGDPGEEVGNGGVYVGLKGNGIMSSAFVYLLTGDTTYGNAAKDGIIAQCNDSAVDWTAIAVGDTFGNNIFVGHWLIRLFNAFEYIKPLLSAGELSVVESWFDGGATWSFNAVNTYLAQNFPNRLSRDYSVRAGTAIAGSTSIAGNKNPNSGTGEAYAWTDDQGGFHNIIMEAHARYCNRTSALIEAAGLWAIYRNNATWIDYATLYLEEWLKFGVYSDGSQAEWNRNGENNNGRAGLGTMYYGTINIECAMVLCDAMRRKGDNSWYEYTTSEGLDFNNVYGQYGSSGGNKNLKLVIDTYVECITQEVNRYWKEVLPANLIDPLQSNNTQYPFDLILGLANQYYKEQLIKDAYKRNSTVYSGITQYNEGIFSSAAGNAWVSGGPIAAFPAFNFMYAENELIDPVNISSGIRSMIAIL